jgi:hypothetical protein
VLLVVEGLLAGGGDGEAHGSRGDGEAAFSFALETASVPDIAGGLDTPVVLAAADGLAAADELPATGVGLGCARQINVTATITRATKLAAEIKPMETAAFVLA